MILQFQVQIFLSKRIAYKQSAGIIYESALINA